MLQKNAGDSQCSAGTSFIWFLCLLNYINTENVDAFLKTLFSKVFLKFNSQISEKNNFKTARSLSRTSCSTGPTLAGQTADLLDTPAKVADYNASLHGDEQYYFSLLVFSQSEYIKINNLSYVFSFKDKPQTCQTSFV